MRLPKKVKKWLVVDPGVSQDTTIYPGKIFFTSTGKEPFQMLPREFVFLPTERQMTLSRLTGRPPEDFIP